MLHQLNPQVISERQLHKFGGSSLADCTGYRRVVSIITEYGGPHDFIVVSAAGDTTNQLLQWLTLSEQGHQQALPLQQKIYHFQTQLIQAVLPSSSTPPLLEYFKRTFAHLVALLKHPLNEAVRAEIVGHGELWSAHLLAALLNQAQQPAICLDARDFLRAERAAQPKIDVERSYPLLIQKLAQYSQQRVVVTGFICRNQAGETVLLGRNGSDYSATQIGALAHVQQVTLWSDVAGIYSADPRSVQNACLLPQLRLDEANELARLGAPILHARTLQPVANSNLLLKLRCSYRPEQGSTRIERVLTYDLGTRVITSHDQIILLELQLPQQYPAAPLQQHIHQLLLQSHIAPLTWHRDATHHLLQWSYTAEVAPSAFQLLKEAALPGELRMKTGCSLVALIGAGVTSHAMQKKVLQQSLQPYHIAHLWQAEEGHSIVAIVHHTQPRRLVQTLHQQLFRPCKQLGIMLLGRGTLSLRWLEHFSRHYTELGVQSRCTFILAGVVEQQQALLAYAGLSANKALAFFDDEAQYIDEQQLLRWLQHHPYDALVILDLTPHGSWIPYYTTFAQYGFHLVSSNHAPGSIPTSHYEQLIQNFTKNGSYWLHSASIVSSIPLYPLLHHLHANGDTILAISGNLSPGLNWILKQYDGSKPFTLWVHHAWQKGLTTSDPRLDLSGTPALHQLVMLVRAAHHILDPSTVRIEPLVPPAWATLPLAQFLTSHNPINQHLYQRSTAAKDEGLRLEYVARFTPHGCARIGIEALPPHHPFALCQPHQQTLMVQSHHYFDSPLLWQGPVPNAAQQAIAIQSDLRQLALLLSHSI